MIFTKSKIYEDKIFWKEKENFELERSFFKNYRKSLFYLISVKMREFNQKMLESVSNVIAEEQNFRGLLLFLSLVTKQKDIEEYIRLKTGQLPRLDINDIEPIIYEYIQNKLPFVIDLTEFNIDPYIFCNNAGETRNLGVIHYLPTIPGVEDYRNFHVKGILLEGHSDILKYIKNKGWNDFNYHYVHKYIMLSKDKDLFYKVFNKLNKNSFLSIACEENNLEFIKILCSHLDPTDDDLSCITNLEAFQYVENKIEGKIDYNKVFMGTHKTDEKMIRYFLEKGCTEYKQMLKNSLENNHMNLALEIYNKKEDWFDLLLESMQMSGDYRAIYYVNINKDLGNKIKNFLISCRGNKL